MTVSELIEELKTWPQNLEVEIFQYDRDNSIAIDDVSVDNERFHETLIIS